MRYISIWYDLFPKIEIVIGRGDDRRKYPSPTDASLARVIDLMSYRETAITMMSNYVNLWQSHPKETR